MKYGILLGLIGVQLGVLWLIQGVTAINLPYYAILPILTILSAIDLKEKIVPNKSHLLILLTSLLSFSALPLSDRLWGAISVSVPLTGVAWLTKGFGGGDVKLFASLGFVIGLYHVAVSAYVALVIAGGYGIVLLLKGASKKREIALVPFIHLGVFLQLTFNLGQWFFFAWPGLGEWI